MNVSQFLDKKVYPDVLSKNVVIHFKGEGTYPLLFFSLLVKKLKSILDMQIETVSVESNNLSQVKAKLETSFLGQQTLYWLQDVGSIKGKNKNNIIEYINAYKGPNIIVLFATNAVKIKKREGLCLVEVGERVAHKDFLKIVSFFQKPISKMVINFIEKIFRLNPVIPLDTACMLMKYAFLTGKGYKAFIDEWLDKIMIPEKSLFTLSQYFFTKDYKKFFQLWSNIRDDYGDVFWIVFWSEQLWRASSFVSQMQNRNFAEAKKVSFRLPFAFTQRIWRNFNVDELKNAHDFIYSVDCSLKNGGDPFSLELFYSKFLNNQMVSA